MSRLRFEFEWQDPAGAHGDDLRATWASLSILIDDQPVTEFHDRQTRSVRNRVFLPLFPVAEWIAANWWFLQSEVERPGLADSRGFDQRHNLRWGREGFVLPSLRFAPRGSSVEAHWQPLDIPSARVRFLSEGRARIPNADFRAAMVDFVNAVIGRLDELSLSNTPLHEEWNAIQTADKEEREFCLAAARLGTDPYSIEQDQADAIIAANRDMRPELFDEFMALATPSELSRQSDFLITASCAIASDSSSGDAFVGIRRHAPSIDSNITPWESGYQYAAALRTKLNGGSWKSHSLEELAGHLGIDRLDQCVVPATGKCRFLDAMTGPNQLNNPKFLIEKTRSDSRQFAFCRALFEHLTLRRDRFAIISGLKTDRQQMSRAFAAEFLAPHESLRGCLSGASISEDEVAELADDYGVSEYVIRHQVENHRLATVSDAG